MYCTYRIIATAKDKQHRTARNSLFCSILSTTVQESQAHDIADYIKSVVYSDSEPIMRRWRTEDKELAIKVLTERADGMYVDHFMLVILIQIVRQVSVGVLSVGRIAALATTEHPACSRGITVTRFFG